MEAAARRRRPCAASAACSAAWRLKPRARPPTARRRLRECGVVTKPPHRVDGVPPRHRRDPSTLKDSRGRGGRPSARSRFFCGGGASSSISGSSSASPSTWGPYHAGAASQPKLFPGYRAFNKATWPSEKIGLAARIPFHASKGATPHRSISVATAQSPAVLHPSTDRKTTTEGCFQAFPHATTAASRSLFKGTASRNRAHGRASFLNATRSTSQSSQSPTS